MENLLSINYQVSSFCLTLLSIVLIVWIIRLYIRVFSIEDKLLSSDKKNSISEKWWCNYTDELMVVISKKNQLLGTRGYQIKKRDEKIAKLEAEIKSIKAEQLKEFADRRGFKNFTKK